MNERVLVVDDNRDMADGIAMLLEETQMEAKVAYSAKGAIALMEAGEFELVLSDIRMPVKTGLDLLESIRTRWPLTKVVLLTAHGSVDSAVEAMRGGACDYLTKPFDNDELLRVVRRAMDGRSTAGGFDSVVGDIAAAVSADDPLRGLERALGMLLHAAGADDGEIFLCEPEGEAPLLCVWAGPDGDALNERVRFDADVGYPGIVVSTNKPLCMKGGLAGDDRFLRQAVTDAGIRSLVAVPLPDARGPIGSIHLMSRRDDFPVEHVLGLLERAAIPIASAVRAWLAALRQVIDEVAGNLEDVDGQPLRAILESMRKVAGAQYGTLALIDPGTGRPSRVVSTGAASLVCACAEAGNWAICSSVQQAQGFVADPGRRSWPEPCRRGLPRKAASPCCLPIVAGERLFGIVVFDFGRDGTDHATRRLVPLMTMAHQVAIRLQSHREGFPLADEASGVASVRSPTPELELRCLGPFTIILRGQQIAAENFTRSKALVLLKLLALKAGAPVHRDVLIEHLWPSADPRQGANRLHGVVHDLRAVIEPHRTEREWLYVRNRGELYYLDVRAPIEIDLIQLRNLSGHRPSEDPASALARLELAAELYRGDLFADDPYAEWCEAERDELRERHVEVLEQLAQHHLELGATEKALTCLRQASRGAPFRDDLLLAQMDLLAQAARPSEALAVYEEHRRALKNDLDVEPSPDIQALHQRLLRAAQKS